MQEASLLHCISSPKGSQEEVMHKCVIASVILLFIASPAHAADQQQPAEQIGLLSCKLQPATGISLLIRSTRYIRCEFTPEKSDRHIYYKGETGIGFGLDIAVNRGSEVAYAVLARRVDPHADPQLAGTYSGAGGTATFGLSAGGTAPIEKQDGSITLQPINADSSGAGVTLGFTYLYLENDPH
ncbi:DUF992 domain-containing protein [Mariprofundus erugo]|uniref:DUF992 domain-containing protein n=2 Tax=Mariprofundus erugo TaxID=2528639 RepID=A0A5R9GX58_9PROT|nr:DUF992 domain-containing protein [Mariprofundus erugo]